ncbi:MAG TPA: hypothetical protein V6D06_17085 [Trichocoleus sp.]
MASSTSPQSGTSSPSGLDALSQTFRRYLQETGLYPRLTELDCRTQQGRLWVLACHPQPQVEDPAGLLRELKAAFFEIMPEVGLPGEAWAAAGEVPVRLGLQLESDAAPYATHTFTWRLEDALGVIFEAPCPQEFMTEGEAQEVPAEILAASDRTSSPPADASSQNGVGDAASHVKPASSAESNPHPTDPRITDSSVANSSAIVPFNDAAMALPETAVEPPAASPVQRWGQWSLGQLKQIAPYWSYGLAGLIVLSSGLFAYTITRPCVVGSCDRIDKAAAFQTSAQARIAAAPTGDSLLEAQSELRAAAELVNPIPPWSRHYRTAQVNLETYRAELAILNYLKTAQETAYTAAQQSQNPPHPVEHWVDIQHLWRQAIAALQKVPDTSPAYVFAQRKLEEYENNLATITHRITAEEEAEANLNSALQAAQLAQQRMETAESLPGWQLAEREWQVAIHGLALIPRGTEAYSKAQTQMQIYQGQLAQAKDLVDREGSATTYYQQARAAASQAATYEAQNQWTLAVAQWQQALASAQRISPTSALGPQARGLVPTYQAALTRSQAQLRTAVAIQSLEAKLGSVCGTSATPCRINATAERVQITLASRYALALEQAITPPPEGTAPAATTLDQEAQALVEQIVQLGSQVQRQIEIYDAQGGFIARYRPDLGGFVKE